jgi:hypothetical protein
VLDDVVQRFLHDPVQVYFLRLGKYRPLGRVRFPDALAAGLPLYGDAETSDRVVQAEAAQLDGKRVVRVLPRAEQRLVDHLGKLAEIGPDAETFRVHRNSRQALADIVVKVETDTKALELADPQAPRPRPRCLRFRFPPELGVDPDEILRPARDLVFKPPANDPSRPRTSEGA